MSEDNAAAAPEGTTGGPIEALAGFSAAARRRLASRPEQLSGPGVARLFQVLLGLVLLDAWVSLGSQLQVLVGSRGLLPVAELMARMERNER